MSTSKIVIRFVEAASQTTGNMTRVIGFVPSRHIFTLFDNPALDANPRKPKVNRVTGDIIATLNETPELFQYKSKGLLIGTSSYEALQRNRYALDFYDPSSEGVLDGGHNMLSMGIFFLSKVMDELPLRKIKDWEDLQEAWSENRSKLEELRDEIEFLIPVELLIPSDNEPETIAAFNIALIDICAARNNNAQLAEEAKANQKGFYDEIRKRMEKKIPEIAERVEWKPNEWASDSTRKIKVRDLIALCWIPLNKLAEEGHLMRADKDKHVLSTINQSDVLEETIVVLRPNDTIQTLFKTIRTTKQALFPIVNSRGSLLGMLYLDDLPDLLHIHSSKPETLLETIMEPILYCALPDDSMEKVMDLFDRSGLNYLPMVQHNQVLGYYSKTKMLDAYRRKIMENIVE